MAHFCPLSSLWRSTSLCSQNIPQSTEEKGDQRGLNHNMLLALLKQPNAVARYTFNPLPDPFLLTSVIICWPLLSILPTSYTLGWILWPFEIWPKRKSSSFHFHYLVDLKYLARCWRQTEWLSIWKTERVLRGWGLPVCAQWCQTNCSFKAMPPTFPNKR